MGVLLLVLRFLLAGIPAFSQPAQGPLQEPAAPTCATALGDQSAGQEDLKLLEALLRLRHELNARLLPFPDPFANMVTLDSAHQLLSALSYQDGPFSQQARPLSILGEVLNRMRAERVSSVAEIRPLVDRIIAFARAQLADNSGSKPDLYRASIALDFLYSSLAPLIPLPTLPETPSPLPSQEKDGKPKPVQKKKQTPPGQKQPAENPDAQKSVSMQKADGDGGGKQDTAIVAEVNLDGVSYFKGQVYNAVNRLSPTQFAAVPLPLARTTIRPFNRSSIVLRRNMFNQPEVTLQVPVGFVPTAMDPTGQGSVLRLADGEYRVRTSEKQALINLVPDDERLNPVQLDFLRQSAGFAEAAWPESLRAELLEPARKLSPIRAAEAVESYIRTKYKYDKKGPIEPMEALEKGAFKCDVAALTMIGIMRDVLHHPCRGVGDFRGQRSVKGRGKSYLALPTERHMWVECFDEEGLAHTFDPTPRSGANEDGEKEKSEYEQNSKFEDEPPSAEPETGDEKSAAEHKRELEQNTADSLKEITGGQQSQGPATDAGEKPEMLTGGEYKPAGEPQSLLQTELGGPLERRARQLFLRRCLDPGLEAYRSLECLQHFKIDGGFHDNLLSFVNQAETALQQRQGSVADALYSLAANLPQQNVRKSFSQLLQIEDRLRLYLQTLDADGEKSAVISLLNAVTAVKKQFLALNENGRIANGMAEKFMTTLPPHTKELVRQQFGIKSIGSNMETANLMAALRSGKLMHYNAIRILYPLSDFIMDSVPTPAYRQVNTYQQDTRYYRGREFLPVTDLSRAYRGLRLQPNRSHLQNMLQGTLVAQVTKQRVNVPDPGGQSDPRRVTVGLFDTSGSMENAPGDFQASLLAAFIDRAASDRSISGVYRHLALLMGFDGKVHTTIPVTNSDQAYDLILHHREKMKNTQGTTDIMAALREAVAQIVAAQEENKKNRRGEPLASANILLMSDGGSTVDQDELVRLLAQVDRRTPLKFYFVGINGTNPALVETAQQVKAAGASESFYTYFTEEQIAEIMNQAGRAPEPDLERELYTDRSYKDLPPGIVREISDIASRASAADQTRGLKSRPHSIEHWHNELSRARAVAGEDVVTPVRRETARLQSLLNRSQVMRNKDFLRIMIDDLMVNFERTFGKDLNGLDLYERERLGHLLVQANQYAQGS